MFTIRDAVVADAPRIAEIRTAAWQRAYRGIVPDEVLDALDVGSETTKWVGIIEAIVPSTEAMQVITDNAPTGPQIVGYVCGGSGGSGGSDESGVGEIMACYLHPDWWGRGAADALLGAGEARLAADGHTGARLWVFGDNARARRFYERNGWVRDGRIETRNTIRFGADAPAELRYTKRLRSAP